MLPVRCGGMLGLGQIQVLTVKNAEMYSSRLKNYEVGGLPFMASLPYASLTA